MQREESEKKIIKDYKISIQEKTSEKVCGISIRSDAFWMFVIDMSTGNDYDISGGIFAG